SPTNVTLGEKSFGHTRLSWEYTSSCPVTRFHITVETKSKPLQLTSSKKEIFFPSLPKCAKFTADVFGSNPNGNGLRSKTLEVFSPEVPVAPSSVRVTTVANTSSISVSWRDNPDCDIDGYLVRIYAKDGSLVTMSETTNQHANILDVPTCVPLVASVQGHNRAGNGSESRSAEFTIQSGKTKNVYLTILLKPLRQLVTGFALLRSYQVGAVPDFPSNLYSIWTQIRLIASNTLVYKLIWCSRETRANLSFVIFFN
ncbi:hypothetical protein T265_12843, partial [Opisthorchis viverrini]